MVPPSSVLPAGAVAVVEDLTMHSSAATFLQRDCSAAAKFVCAFVTACWPGGSAAILRTWRGRLVYFGVLRVGLTPRLPQCSGRCNNAEAMTS